MGLRNRVTERSTTRWSVLNQNKTKQNQKKKKLTYINKRGEEQLTEGRRDSEKTGRTQFHKD